MNRILALAFVLIAAPSFAADAVLVKLTGPVYLRAAGASKDIVAHGGEELLYGDAVRTGPGAIAQIELTGRGAVLIREKSAFILQGDPQKTLLNFKFGEFLIGLRKALIKDESFRVRTPAAVAAVRGTLFWGKSDETKATTYAGLEHVIAVTAKGKTVLIPAGLTTTVAYGEPPSDPKPHAIPASYLKNFAVDGGLQGLDAMIEAPKAAAPAPATLPLPGSLPPKR
jgi:ferric-dicitrate binding protein FerR (iron transport regulator)